MEVVEKKRRKKKAESSEEETKKKKSKRKREHVNGEQEDYNGYDQILKKGKKKKRKKRDQTKEEQEEERGVEQTVRKEKKKVKEEEKEGECGVEQTVSIAIAGSIIYNAQSYALATRLAGQIARAATIFRIDEVIVFDYKANTSVTSNVSIWDSESGALFLTRILQYLEMPQYLRRELIPTHNSLRYVGLLPPLDAPHHARKHEWILYREGVTLDRKSAAGFGTFVDVGLRKAVFIQQTIKPGQRLTVAMGSNKSLEPDCVRQAVKRSEPKLKMGLYWGYNVRYASSIGDVFKECPYKGGYDYSIGTSEHGDIVRSADLVIPKFRHLLIAFGGLGGLEENIEEDENLQGKDVMQLFNRYLNTCPNQGSRTIRTEEATFISLQYFEDPIRRAHMS